MATAADIVTAVRRHFGAERDNLGPEYAALDEFSLRVGPGWPRADVFVVRAWGGQPKGHERHTIEVKVSRSDLTAELADPSKRAPWVAISHYWWLATPPGLLRDLADLPAAAGLIEVSDTGRCLVRAKASRRIPDELDPASFVEAFRRAARAEARIRDGAANGDPAAEAAALRAQVASLERRLQTARSAVHRERTRMERAYDLILHLVDGAPCVCGGAPVVRSRRAGYGWAHADGSDCSRRWPWPDHEHVAGRLALPDPIDIDSDD